MSIQRLSIWLGTWLILTSAMLAAQTFPDTHEQPIRCWSGPVFKLSQSYPKQLPAQEPFPWSGIDFKKYPESYMKAVLSYALKGNTEVDWEVEKNSFRKWYHAPWLHWGEGGREFVHGMTRERHSRPKELADTQVTEAQTWAVSVYNELGGYTLGQVWANPTAPDPKAAHFLEGTVAVKLLFTDASLDEVPYLKGAKEWQAFVAARSEPRRITTLRLLQVDFAVRDGSADDTPGWVFGTFQYHYDAKGTTPWQKLVPVALTWGNDPGLLPPQGLEPGGKPTQSWINPGAPIVRYREDVLHLSLGWAGRANGPVDNSRSSCLSCHATALHPATIPLTPDDSLSDAEKLKWFQNLKAGKSLDPDRSQGLDYSLQLAAGIGNFYSWVDIVQNLGVVSTAPESSKPAFLEPGHKDGPFLIYGISREEDEQKGIRLLPAHQQ
jgi:hypothetical protein